MTPVNYTRFRLLVSDNLQQVYDTVARLQLKLTFVVLQNLEINFD